MRRLLVLPPLLIVLLCGFLAVNDDSSSGVVIQNVRLGQDAQGQTRIVLDLDRRPEYLAGPTRQENQSPQFVISLAGGKFALDQGQGARPGVGWVEKFRFDEGVVRFDLAGPALPSRSFVLPPAGQKTFYRLVIDLDSAADAQFAEEASAFEARLQEALGHNNTEMAEASVASEASASPSAQLTLEQAGLSEPNGGPSNEGRRGGVLSLFSRRSRSDNEAAQDQTSDAGRLADAAGFATSTVAALPVPSLKPAPRDDVLLSQLLPQIIEAADEAPSALVPRRVKSRPLIVLDPGHGGRDSGAVGINGTHEDAITLAYSKVLKAALMRRGYDVMLTRSDDTLVPHEERIGLARDVDADLFMSIHADSIKDRSVRGASVYTLSERRSERLGDDIRKDGNFVLYDVEVSSDDGVGDILLDLAKSATMQNSDRLASALVRNMRGKMPLVKNPKRRGALLVLLSPDVPAVLVELAFLSNAADEANLRSSAWRQLAVTAIADGVDAYFDETGVEARLAGAVSDSGL